MEDLTGKNQSFFDNFHLKVNLTGKIKVSLITFFHMDDLTGKNQSFFKEPFWLFNKKKKLIEETCRLKESYQRNFDFSCQIDL